MPFGQRSEVKFDTNEKIWGGNLSLSLVSLLDVFTTMRGALPHFK
jgi:hypothetical protein